jgi:hypothetical protein
MAEYSSRTFCKVRGDAGLRLSDLVTLQAANLGAARQNAGQLEALEQAVTP